MSPLNSSTLSSLLPLLIFVSMIFERDLSKISLIVRFFTNSKQKNFAKEIISSLHRETVQSFDEMVILFKKTCNVKKENWKFNQILEQYLDYSFCYLLKEYNLLATKKINPKYSSLNNVIFDAEDHYGDLDLKEIDKIHLAVIRVKEKINSFREFNLKNNPNLDLPIYERGLFNSIELYLEANKPEMVKEKLSQLSGAVKTLHEDVRKNSMMNKISFWLGIVGFISLLWTYLALWFKLN